MFKRTTFTAVSLVSLSLIDLADTDLAPLRTPTASSFRSVSNSGITATNQGVSYM